MAASLAQLADLLVGVEPLGVALGLGQQPGQVGKARECKQEWPVSLTCLVADGAQCLELVPGQVLGFVDEEGESAALLLCRVREVLDQLAQVGLELP